MLNPITHSQLSRRNRGVTLTEVLIAMGILAVGLLGAAAMFPVGSYYMQKGEIADRGSAIARAAFSDLVARGELSPQNWYMYTPGGVYVPMSDFMANWMAANANPTTGQYDQAKLNAEAGFIYLIDPYGIASAAAGTSLNWGELTYAPVARRWGTPLPTNNGSPWAPFAYPADGGNHWPIRRLCTSSALVNGTPVESLAATLYRSGDDVSFSIPDEDDQPSQQLLALGQADLDNDGQPDPLARQSKGDYSWMAMVAPTQNAAQLAVGLDPSAYYYDVSVVVFYKRTPRLLDSTESLVAGAIVSTGTSGGEIFLDSDSITDAYEDFKTGQWVLVTAPHPSSTDAKPLLFSQWYRVLTIADEPDDLDYPPGASNAVTFDNKNTQRLVGLRGPDWPWPAGTEVRVGLFPGAVAVHTKTMRLDGKAL